jgi:hypothetical protein
MLFKMAQQITDGFINIDAAPEASTPALLVLGFRRLA